MLPKSARSEARSEAEYRHPRLLRLFCRHFTLLRASRQTALCEYKLLLSNSRAKTQRRKGFEKKALRVLASLRENQKSSFPELRLKQQGTDKIVFHTLLFPVQGTVDVLPMFEVTDSGYKVSFAGNTWTIQAPSIGEWGLV